MTETYFKNFPVTEYANTAVVDITRRAKTVDSINSNPYIYYPYVIENNERHDQIADKFWSDYDLGWLLFMSNQIIDPYYQWYLQDQELYDFILKKYGTYELAAEKIKHFRVIDSEEVISSTRYEELSPHEFKYWCPVYESKYNLSGYKRKKLDWIVNTNAIVEYTLASHPTDIAIGSKIKIKISPSSFGTAEVTNIQDNKITCNHIQNDAIENDTLLLSPSSYLYVNTHYIISDIKIVRFNIPLDEFKYWEAVSFLTWETESNEYNKTLRIMNPGIVPGVVTDFKEKMK